MRTPKKPAPLRSLLLVFTFVFFLPLGASAQAIQFQDEVQSIDVEASPLAPDISLTGVIPFGFDPPSALEPGHRETRETEVCITPRNCFRYRVTVEVYQCPGPASGICLRIVKIVRLLPGQRERVECDTVESCGYSFEIRDNGFTLVYCYRGQCTVITVDPATLRFCIQDSEGTECWNYAEWSEEQCRADCKQTHNSGAVSDCLQGCYRIFLLLEQIKRLSGIDVRRPA